MKYLTSQTELNITGFKFVNKFEKCNKCFPGIENIQKIYGPYLYENELFLPRAYIVNNSILVVGKNDNAMQIIYGLMLDSSFDPKKAVIILGKESINDYSIEELKRFNSIFLTQGSIDQNSFYILQEYKRGGGIIVPDLTIGEQSISNEKIIGILNSFKGNLNPVDDKYHIFINFDKRKLNINGKKGFLVYSEVLTHYPGWIALADGKEKGIYRADGIIGAIYLDAPTQELILEFKPKSFVIGSIITVTSITLLIIFFVFRYFLIRKKQENSQFA